MKQNNSSSTTKKSLAKIISNTLNPIVFVIVILLFLVPLLRTFVEWYVVPILVFFALIVPIGFLVWQLAKGEVSDFFMKHQKQRDLFYIFTFISLLIGSILLSQLKIPRLLKFSLSVGLAQIALMGIINRIWKISAHTSTAALLCCVLVFLYGYAALPSFLIIPIVGWSRIELQYHTALQTISGALFSTANFFITAAFFYPAIHL